jgi:hypothetical protein
MSYKISLFTLLDNEIPTSKIDNYDNIYIKKLLNKTHEYDTLIELLNLKCLINKIADNADLCSSIDLLIRVYSGHGSDKEKVTVKKLKETVINID